VYGIGVSFKLADGTIVSPDLLVASRRGYALLAELKGGTSIDHDQLGRMLRVTAQDLRDFAYIPMDNPAAFRVGVVEVCNAEHLDTFVTATQGRAVSILSFDKQRFRVGGSPIPDGSLHQALEAANVASWPPLNIVPFDRESSLGDIARQVVPHIVADLVRGNGTITAESIVQKTHSRVFDSMSSTGSRSERAEIIRKVSEVLSEGTTNELREWLERIPNPKMWRFRKALSTDQAIKTRELKSLQRAAASLVDRLGGATGIQLKLFEDFDSGPHAGAPPQ
jgi:hypothetical protein